MLTGSAGVRLPAGADETTKLTLAGTPPRLPVVTILVDSPDRIAASFEIVDAVTRETGLVTSEIVPTLTVLSG